MIPKGKGIFIWNLDKSAGGDPVRLANNAKDACYNWISIKVQNGTKLFKPDLAKSAINTLRAFDIEVFGWGYLYGGNYLRQSIAAREADITLQAVEEYGLSGFMLDIEKHYKRQPYNQSWAATYLSRVKARAPYLTLGLCSYRYPSYHPEIPWSIFLNYSNYHIPQLYWIGAHNPADQLTRSYNELQALKELPYIPLGSAYWVSGWEPTLYDFAQFFNTALVRNFPGLGYYVWEYAEQRSEWWKVLADQKMVTTPDHKPDLDTRLFRIETDIDRLEREARSRGWSV